MVWSSNGVEQRWCGPECGAVMVRSCDGGKDSATLIASLYPHYSSLHKYIAKHIRTDDSFSPSASSAVISLELLIGASFVGGAALEPSLSTTV